MNIIGYWNATYCLIFGLFTSQYVPFISNNITNLESIEDYGGFKTQTRLIKVKQEEKYFDQGTPDHFNVISGLSKVHIFGDYIQVT